MGIRLRGQPRKYETAEDLQERIQYYFDSITRDVKRVTKVNRGTDDEPSWEEEPVLNNACEEIIDVIYVEEPSVEGLCLFLGITRETLSQYEKREGYTDTVREAKQIILCQKLALLPILKNPRGLMFDLSANYDMHEKVKQELSGEIKMPTIKFGK